MCETFSYEKILLAKSSFQYLSQGISLESPLAQELVQVLVLQNRVKASCASDPCSDALLSVETNGRLRQVKASLQLWTRSSRRQIVNARHTWLPIRGFYGSPDMCQAPARKHISASTTAFVPMALVAGRSY